MSVSDLRTSFELKPYLHLQSQVRLPMHEEECKWEENVLQLAYMPWYSSNMFINSSHLVGPWYFGRLHSKIEQPMLAVFAIGIDPSTCEAHFFHDGSQGSTGELSSWPYGGCEPYSHVRNHMICSDRNHTIILLSNHVLLDSNPVDHDKAKTVMVLQKFLG